MTETPSESPLLDLLADMTAQSIATSDLDAQTLMLVRIAALVAVDAPTISYVLNLEASAVTGLTGDEMSGVLAAIAPIVGTARIASASGRIFEALAVEIEIAEMGAQD